MIKKIIYSFLVVAVLSSCKVDEKAETQRMLRYVKEDVENFFNKYDLKGDKYNATIDSSRLKIPKNFFKNADEKEILKIPFLIGKEEDSLYLEYVCSIGYLEEGILSIHVSPKLYKIIDSAMDVKRPISLYNRGWNNVYIDEIKK
jgi:hypothetical protein